MATEVKMYRSDAGKVFDTMRQAAEDDLRVFVAQMVENDALADKFVRAVTPDQLGKLVQISTTLKGVCDAETAPVPATWPKGYDAPDAP